MTPEQAATELLRRRAARDSLKGFAKAIDVPGRPVGEDENAWIFDPIESPIFLHHEVMMDAVEKWAWTRYGRLMIMAPPGSAKALALDTPIATPSGWTTMGELRVGDKVFGDDGKPCNVTWVSPIWRDGPVYGVDTDCGDRIVAHADHEWRVRLCGKSEHRAIVETRDLARKRSKRPMIDRPKALELPETELPLDPYVFGVWLGDGNGGSGSVTSSLSDQPWLRGEIERLGYITRDRNPKTNFGIADIRKHLVSLGVLYDPWHNQPDGRKHIPAIYMRASANQRLSLLQGLIDTDGSVSKTSGMVTFCNTNHELAFGALELARSLGVKASINETRATLYGKDCGPVWRVNFFMANAARMPRKAILCKDGTRTPGTYVEAKLIGTADTVCIEVDSPSHLFLAGRSMTPTHNSSYASVVTPPYVMGKRAGSRFIFGTYAQPLADKQSKRARQICRSAKYQAIFGTTIPKGFEGAEAWSLDNASEFMAVGMLAGSTGNRATHLIIDDPIKGREDADSERVRDKTWDAYMDDLKTRLIPGGCIMIIQTRWHEDDLAGRILPADYDGASGEILCRDGQVWTVLNIQAKAERSDDPIGRPLGGYLCPEWFEPKHWAQFENNPSPAAQRTWSALFQQRPAADNGGQFERVWFDGGEDSSGRVCVNSRYTRKELPALSRMRIFGASDWAVTEKTTADFTEHGIWGMDEHGVLWALDWKWGQVNSEKAVELNIDLILEWRPIAWGGETGKDENAIQPIRDRRMVETKAMTTVELLPSNQDKVAKAASFRAMASMGRVRFPADSVFAERVIAQLVKFPAGAHDDAVDVCGHAGRMVDRMWKAPADDTPPERPRFLHEIQSREIFALDTPARGGSGRI